MNLKKYILNILYGLPFGLKKADSEIMGAAEIDSNGTEISQEVSNQRVAKHLLKGEVTQEVEELRYRTYKVANESENYTYIGNGITVKNENKNDVKEKTKHKFSQENGNICESVLDGLKQVGNYGLEKYRLEVDYNGLVRFKVEKFATKIDVNIDDTSGLIETTLHFNSEPDPYDAASKPFINEISKLLTTKSEYEISRNEIATNIKNISFATYRANGEDDFVTYSFVNGGKYKSFKQDGYEYLMTLVWEEYMRVPLNLEAKYYSKSMAEKYAKNEKKNVVIALKDAERKRYCSVCGKEMSVYDADIQEANGNAPVCNDCMKKAFKNNQN